MIRHLVHAALVLTLAGGLPAHAQAPSAPVPAEHEALFEALALDRVVALVREEGVAQGEALAEEMLGPTDRLGWPEEVARVHDEEAMRARLLGGMSEALDGRDVEAMTGFFASERGARIIELELAAREAMTEEDVELAARAGWDVLPEEDPERAARVERFVEVNDLVEENVEGALNASFAFLRGLEDGGAFPEPVPEAELLAEVWESEPEIRADLEGWLGGFLTLAYEPLEDEALDAYIAFSETEEGQALNRALFVGFDAMYRDLSFDLGRAVASRMVGRDI